MTDAVTCDSDRNCSVCAGFLITHAPCSSSSGGAIITRVAVHTTSVLRVSQYTCGYNLFAMLHARSRSR